MNEFPDDVWAEFVRWGRRKQDPDSSALYVRHQRERSRDERETSAGSP